MFRSIIIAWLTAWGISLSLVAADAKPVIEGDPIQLRPSGDRVIWEAEWPNRLTGTFELLQDKACSGKAAMWTREGTGRQNGGEARAVGNNPVQNMGIADYYVTVPKDGRYQLYMRVWAMDKCGNSCWVAINDMTLESMRYFPGGKYGRLGSNNHNDWPADTLERWIWVTDETAHYFLRKGTHHIRLQVREDGMGIDQIALFPRNTPNPTSALTPTQLPGSKGLPQGISFSTHTPSTVSSLKPTPYDLYVTIDDPVVTGQPLQTTGSAWLRLNGSTPVDVNVSIDCPGAAITPAKQITCRLSPQAPLVVVPLTFQLPDNARRCTFAVSVNATSSKWPDLVITRQHRLMHALDWMVTSPMSYSYATQLFRELADNTPHTKDSLPTKINRKRFNWTHIKPRLHYNAFGAVDLSKVHGDQTDTAVVAVTWITAEKAAPVSIFGAGDDMILLYSDDRRIMNDFRRTPLTDTIKLHPVRLDRGRQMLIAICYQNQRWWQYHVEFRTTDGKPTDQVYGHSWE